MEPAAYAKIRATRNSWSSSVSGGLRPQSDDCDVGHLLSASSCWSRSPRASSAPISDGSVTTIGILIGLFVIVSAFVLTGIYVGKANTTFDELNGQILQESE